MKAMIFEKIGQPLKLVDMPIPDISSDQILIKVQACGVCRTELDQIEGRIKPFKLPVILGHQIAGIVEKAGENCKKFSIGDLAGATWLYSSCRKCQFCIDGRENLCDEFKATGCHENGGYAEYFVIDEKYAVKIPIYYKNKLSEVAPLMCGGSVGYRSIRLADIKNGENISIWGFGSANHQVFQIIKYLYPDSKIMVHTRNREEQILAKKLGADYVYSLDETPYIKADKAIYTIPVWSILLRALKNLNKGGKIVINLIRMQDEEKQMLLYLDYKEHLWMEKQIQTVANITKKDAEDFLNLAAKIPVKPEIEYYELTDANKALQDLKEGRIKGSKVLLI